MSAEHAGRRNVMAAAWSMPLDFTPPKVAVVLDKQTFTRELPAGQRPVRAGRAAGGDGRRHFDDADDSLRSPHHIAGGHFYAIGNEVTYTPTPSEG